MKKIKERLMRMKKIKEKRKRKFGETVIMKERRKRGDALSHLDKVKNAKCVCSDCVNPLYSSIMLDDKISQLLKHLRRG